MFKKTYRKHFATGAQGPATGEIRSSVASSFLSSNKFCSIDSLSSSDPVSLLEASSKVASFPTIFLQFILCALAETTSENSEGLNVFSQYKITL